MFLNMQLFDDSDNHPQLPKYVGCNPRNAFVVVEADVLPGVARSILWQDPPLFLRCLGISKKLDGMPSHGFENHDANLPRCYSFVTATIQSERVEVVEAHSFKTSKSKIKNQLGALKPFKEIACLVYILFPM